MTFALGVYTEFPVDLIRDIHFKKSGGGTPGDCGCGSGPYCGRYGYGAQVVFSGTIVTAQPFGTAFPPFVGTFSTTEFSGNSGGITTHVSPMPETLTAGTGQEAIGILLSQSDMKFTDQQLEQYGAEWLVPMATGCSCVKEPITFPTDGTPQQFTLVAIPSVIQSYDVNVSWQSSISGAISVGIGMSHPRTTPETYTPLAPEVPQFILGITEGGGGGAHYDFQWEKFAALGYHIDATNEYDLAVGGPVFLWWMFLVSSNGGEPFWSTAGPGVGVGFGDPIEARKPAEFMSALLRGIGDFYTWEVVATCQPEPALSI